MRWRTMSRLPTCSGDNEYYASRNRETRDPWLYGVFFSGSDLEIADLQHVSACRQ